MPKYELNKEQIQTLKTMLMTARVNYQERTAIDDLLRALSKPDIEPKK